MGNWQGAGQGALAGAAAGAALGPWGAAGGAVIGGALGYFSGGGGGESQSQREAREMRARADMLRQYTEGQFRGAQGRQAPMAQGAQLAGYYQNQSREGQMALANRLNAVESGQQAGAGELAVNRQARQAAANQFAAQGMARGSNSATAARAAAGQLGNLGVNAAGMASQSAMADQAAARGQLGSLYDSMRGMDINFAGQNAQLAQQLALANQNAMLQQRGMNDSYGLGMLGAYQGAGSADMALRGEALQREQQNRMFNASLLQAGGTALASYYNQRRPVPPAGQGG